MTAPAVQETVEERARRLGLVSSSGAGETVEQRAHRLGLDAPAPTGHLGKPFVDAKPDDSEPGAFTKTMGVLAALNRDIPGAEVLQTLARMGGRSLIGRPESYTEARDDIRGAEDAAPWQATLPARVSGAVLSGAVLPGGAVAKGAQFGGLTGALDSDPTLSKDQRAENGIGGTIVGGLAGGLASKAGSLTARAARPVIGAAKRLGQSGLGSLADLASTTEGNLMPAEVMRPGPDIVGAIGKRAVRPVVRLGGQAEPDITTQLRSLLRQVGGGDPISDKEAFLHSDAAEAMGLAPHQQPDLEDLLRRSLNQPKPTPSLGLARGKP